MNKTRQVWLGLLASVAAVTVATAPALAQKKPNVVMLMTDDTGWTDFGAYLGGSALGHPTPHIDRVAAEGAMFTNWYGQASCTAGRASFMTGRIPIRSALSVVVVPGDPNGLTKETPISAEFYQKNGYSTYFSGKWHLGDKPEFYPIEHGFDEMKQFAAYFMATATPLPMRTRGSRRVTLNTGRCTRASSISTNGKARRASRRSRATTVR
jgi:arylsulfatase A-like enzyme